jgi:uncharacterized protein (DUF2147 family)
MKKVSMKPILILVIAFMAQSLFAQKATDKILGQWFNEEKDGKVEIYKQGDKYFGKLVWLKTPLDVNGKPKLDKENPDAKLKTRALEGLVLLTNFVFDGDDEWEDGEIYDPKSGKTYSCYMEFDRPDVLIIKGYIGVKWIGKTTYWTKAK